MYALSIALAALLAASGVTCSPSKTTRNDVTPLEVGTQQCFPQPTNGPLVIASTQDENIPNACDYFKTIGPGTEIKQEGKGSADFEDSDSAGGQPGITYRVATDDGAPFYIYSINWISGCRTTVREQDVTSPISDQAASISCYALMSGNYVNCINGGVGGYIDVGCLRYSFSVAS